jgi:hypothetical protein
MTTVTATTTGMTHLAGGSGTTTKITIIITIIMGIMITIMITTMTTPMITTTIMVTTIMVTTITTDEGAAIRAANASAHNPRRHSKLALVAKRTVRA